VEVVWIKLNMKARNIIKLGLAGILGTALLVGNPSKAKAPLQTEEYQPKKIICSYNPVIPLKKRSKEDIKKIDLRISLLRSEKYVRDFYKMNPDVSFEKEYVLATIFAESRGDALACSEDSALGLTQVLKNTWEWIEPSKDFEEYAFDPLTNIDVGVKTLGWFNGYCGKKYGSWNELGHKNKLKFTSACYNGGQKTLRKKGWDISKMPKETRDYVKDVLWAYNELKN
jgi:soluble lytic murein transglycosylase-like protein